MSEKTDKKKPVKTFRYGHVQAAVWRNTLRKNDREIARFSITVRKRYRDNNGNWKTTDHFFPHELGDVMHAAADADRFVRRSNPNESE